MQVRQGANEQYFQIGCSIDLAGAGVYLTSHPVPDVDTIGECLAACVAYNENGTNTGLCAYGQIWFPAEAGAHVSCDLWGNSVESEEGGPSDHNSFALVTNATLIASACFVDSTGSNVTSSSTSDTSFTTSDSSSTPPSTTSSTSAYSTSSSATPVPTDPVCPDSNGTVYTDTQGKYQAPSGTS